ncbi:hypothetical protein V8C86DRAFT_2584233 [Haematococcus lacustris]
MALWRFNCAERPHPCGCAAADIHWGCFRSISLSRGLPECRISRRRSIHAVPAFREWFSSFVAAPTAPQHPQKSQQPVHRSPPRRDYLEARQISLYQMFDAQENQFDIPSFQRPYSWRHKQVMELLQDFLTAYRNKTEYFLGSVVTVKAQDGAYVPMQVIDGQQRLTTLLILLAFVHAFAKQQDNQVLEQRIKRMLYIDADPLDPDSKGRFRLRLRPGDDLFFMRNLLVSYLPTKFQLSGVAASECLRDEEEGPGCPADSDARPLENETWWRIYDNAQLVAKVLGAEMERGLNLQDFMIHTLKNCHVVLMAARDEATSFRIFATLNSRGMDLSMVDKLKADLLEVLEPGLRQRYSAAWSQMEDILGRVAFHRVFNYMMTLARVLNNEGEALTVLEYFSSKRSDPAAAASIVGVALDYGRILLQLRQCRFEVAPPSAAARLATGSSRAADAASGLGLLVEDERGGIVTSLDAGGPDSAVTTYGAVRTLERQARHMAHFKDDMWLPATLEFFLQVDDMDLRALFLQYAEALQIYLELCGDEAVRISRWKPVLAALLKRSDPNTQPELADVFSAISLTEAEKAMFRARLDQKDLASSAEPRTLVHLLLRAEGCAVSASPDIAFNSLALDKMVPANPPEGSMWRRVKLVPAAQATAQATAGAGAASSSRASSRGRSGSSGPDEALQSSLMHLVRAAVGSRRRSPATSTCDQGHKYWFDVQRNVWHGRLGNLVLLPLSTPALASIANADYDVKAAFYRQCGVESRFPEWSGSIVSGRFSSQRFSFEECKARHSQLVARLAEIYLELEYEDLLWPEEEDWQESSVY